MLSRFDHSMKSLIVSINDHELIRRSRLPSMDAASPAGRAGSRNSANIPYTTHPTNARALSVAQTFSLRGDLKDRPTP